jgi:sugar/nucleoside kinase (ribokinase family)
MTSRQREIPGTWPLGPVTVLGAHILDVLGRPVEAIPPGQGSARLTEIRATAAGTAAGTGVDLAKLGADVLAVGAIGDDLLGDVVAIALARHGVDTSGLGSDAGIASLGQVLDFLGRAQPEAASRIAAAAARRAAQREAAQHAQEKEQVHV